MDYKKVAQDIIDNVGGKENIKGMTHCFTRLRFVLNDSSKASKEVVSRLEGVIQVVVAAGQFQVVLGSKVNKIYDAAVELLGGEIGESEAGAAPAEKQSIWNTLLQKIGEIFTPIVPAIAASGLIKGILAAISRLGWVDPTASTYVIMNAASNAIFYFMPIFLAYTTAKALKCNQVISMILGAFLCMPAIDALVQNLEVASTIYGLPVVKMAFTVGNSSKVFAYTESVIPIILGIIVLSLLEKWLKKVVPEVLHLVVVPGVCLLVMLPVMLTVVGPVGIYIGIGIQWVYNAMMGISPLLGGAVVGGLWGVCVIFGAHRALLPIGLNDVAVSSVEAVHNAELGGCGAGHNTLMCYAGSANFAQAGAALGVMLKTKSVQLKQVAASGFISAALVGVTEPAIYGCNLRLKKPMICAVIAGAMGGAVMGLGGASNHGFANNGILTIPAYQCTANTMGQFVAFLIGIAVAFFGAAILTYIVGFEDEVAPAAKTETTKAATGATMKLAAPVEGKIIPQEQIPDEVFASGALGQGIGVIPTSGDIVAPVDCEVSMVFETKHAIGLTTGDAEILLHVGVNTVELKGKCFETFVKAGDKVKKGQKLMHVDFDGVKAAGYDPTVIMLISNTDEFASVTPSTQDAAALLTLAK